MTFKDVIKRLEKGDRLYVEQGRGAYFVAPSESLKPSHLDQLFIRNMLKEVGTVYKGIVYVLNPLL